LPAPDTGRRVAIIGGGPGGLSAAWQLRLQGHEVTVFEADAEVGGKLRQVIPSERLPADALASEIDRIKGWALRSAPTPASMRRCSNDSASSTMPGDRERCAQPGSDPLPGHERLVKGLEFLKAINRGERPAVGEKVVVLGAGNAGMDGASAPMLWSKTGHGHRYPAPGGLRQRNRPRRKAWRPHPLAGLHREGG